MLITTSSDKSCFRPSPSTCSSLPSHFLSLDLLQFSGVCVVEFGVLDATVLRSLCQQFPLVVLLAQDFFGVVINYVTIWHQQYPLIYKVIFSLQTFKLLAVFSFVMLYDASMFQSFTEKRVLLLFYFGVGLFNLYTQMQCNPINPTVLLQIEASGEDYLLLNQGCYSWDFFGWATIQNEKLLYSLCLQFLGIIFKMLVVICLNRRRLQFINTEILYCPVPPEKMQARLDHYFSPIGKFAAGTAPVDVELAAPSGKVDDTAPPLP